MALLVGGVASAVWLEVFDDDGHPSTWDPRVANLIRFVERERGLAFEHPVAVRFLAEPEFRREVTSEGQELTDEDKAEVKALEGAFRALGLLEGDVNLLEQADALAGEGVLAYYDTDAQEMVVRGTEMTVGVRVTLVHELTHALQDQHFDLSRLDDEDLTGGEYSALEALVEGDAQRIEYAYAGALDEDDQEAYDRELSDAREGVEGLEDVPAILEAYFGAPYFFGEALVTVLEMDGGGDAIDDALRDPPTSEEHLMNPFTFLEGDEPKNVPALEPRAGEEEIDSDDFGAITWFLALAERIDPRRALQAVDGWGGDAYLLYRSGGRSCVRALFEGDTGRDTDEMAAALEDWVATMPGGAAAVRRSGARVLLRSCDPGTDVELGVKGVADKVIALPILRTFFTAGVASGDVRRSEAECAGREFIAGMSDEQVLAADELLYAEEFSPEILNLVGDAAEACGLPRPEGFA